VNVHSRHILQDLSMGLGLNPVHDIFYVINIEWKDVLRSEVNTRTNTSFYRHLWNEFSCLYV
jgi:hypothetical protein